MEGYLLSLRKDRDAQLWFCVLEHGVLRCLAKPGGALVESVPLTRHSVRVVVHADGVCPNEFAVCATEVQFDEARAKLRLLRANERVFRFAAPSPDKMRKWGRAIQNWRRYAFCEPASSAANASAEASSARKAALRDEAHALINFVTSFDLRLKLAVPQGEATESKSKSKTPMSRSSLVSSTTGAQVAKTNPDGKADRMSLPTGRVTSFTSWIPVPRMPSWRRMWPSPTDSS